MASISATIGRPGAVVLAVAALAVAAVTVPVVTGGGSGGSDTANIWVELGAGTCTGGSSSTPITYAASASPDRRCGTLDQANDAMNSGDLACIRPGTYPGQLVTGNKTSETTFRGCEDGVTFTEPYADPLNNCPAAPGVDAFQTGILCVTANFFTLENVTIDQEDLIREATGIGQANGADITFRDVNFHGERPSFQAQGDRFHWDGGEIGESGQPAGQRWCGDGNPMTLNGDDTVIENLTIWPQGSDQTPYTSNPCGSAQSSNGFHLENIRVEGAAGVIIRNNEFKAGSEAGSGHIFFTGAATTGAVMEGNYFGANSDGASAAQNSSNMTSGCGSFTWRYNTFEQPFLPSAPCDTNGTWTGNAGAYHCGGTHSKNVWFGSSSCSGDTTVSGAFSNLGLTSSGRPQSGSAVINAGEATCATVSPDHDGTARPTGGSNCDAGAFEYAGG